MEVVPAKLRARRVRVHVETTLLCIVRLNMHRDAARCAAIDEVSWASYDLYTIALDTCDDAGLRDLVSQARASIVSQLLTQ